MGHNLEAPGDDEDPQWGSVYRCRGDEVVAYRPVFTGDVYTDVEIAGEDEPKSVIVVQHPCVIRSGPDLARRLLVCEVVPNQLMKRSHWPKAMRIMPLNELEAEPAVHYAAKFLEHLVVTPKQLLDGTRVACMSQTGVNLLMQRWVHHNSRLIVPTWLYQEFSGAQFEEADIMEDWCTERLDDGIEPDQATEEIEHWLSESVGSGTRRDLLKDPQRRAEVRREALGYLRTLRAGE